MKDAEHLPAWRAFNKNVGTNGDIGIWHETYRSRPGEHETVYVNMPRFGLGRAMPLVEAKGRRHSAESRLMPGAANVQSHAADRGVHSEVSPLPHLVSASEFGQS